MYRIFLPLYACLADWWFFSLSLVCGSASSAASWDLRPALAGCFRLLLQGPGWLQMALAGCGRLSLAPARAWAFSGSLQWKSRGQSSHLRIHRTKNPESRVVRAIRFARGQHTPS